MAAVYSRAEAIGIAQPDEREGCERRPPHDLEMPILRRLPNTT